MISILPYSKNSINFASAGHTQPLKNTVPAANPILASTGIKDAKALAEQGSGYLKTNDFDKAVECFKKSIELRPEFKETYLPLGKSYKGKEDYPNAINSFKTYLEEKPSDVDALILLGESYNASGRYSEAAIQYTKALTLDPSNDLAKRNLAESKNNSLACYDPITAINQKREQSINNLNTALTMAKNYLTSGYLKDMGDLSIAFDKTAKLGGTSNIAQYEHSKKRITVSDTYTYAAPQIITSYLVHEFVHAKDKDSYTSVREEQDAYKVATEFWIKNSNGVADPELDYAADLYNKSPETLAARVEEIYKLRDSKIASVSPNHPPSNKHLAASNLTELNSGQPLQNYDVIA